jgi:hypothetical protein
MQGFMLIGAYSQLYQYFIYIMALALCCYRTNISSQKQFVGYVFVFLGAAFFFFFFLSAFFVDLD